MSPSWDGMVNVRSDGRRGRRGVLAMDARCYGVERSNASSVGIKTLSNLLSLPAAGTLLAVMEVAAASGGYQKVLDLGYSAGATAGALLETVSDRTFAFRWYNGAGVSTSLKDTHAFTLGARVLAAAAWDASGVTLSLHAGGATVGSVASLVAGPVAASGPVTMWAAASNGIMGWAVLSEKLDLTALNTVAQEFWGPYAAGVARGSLWGGVRFDGADGAALTDTATYGVGGDDPLLLDVEGMGSVPSDWVTEAGSTVSELTITGPRSS